MAYLEVKNLYYKYEDQWVLEDISFEGKKGDLIAIVGPSGCGKSTLLKAIVGILSPQQGSIIISSNNITDNPIETRNIGYVPQNQGLFPHLTVYENIAFGLKAQKWKKDDISKHILELAEISGLEDVLTRKPHEISGGQQQRVALLRALAPFPRLLLLDEPLSNIDSHLREQLAIYIRKIQEELEITTIFVTHDLEEAKMLADKLIIINQGRILQIGSSIEVNTNPLSFEVASILGLKNLYKTRSIVENKEKQSIGLISELGNIEISVQNLSTSFEDIKGVYINPTKIKISREPFKKDNSYMGTIIAIIPYPMLMQTKVLVSIPNFFDKSNKKDFKILRVQILSSTCDYQISESVYVNILEEGIRIYQ